MRNRGLFGSIAAFVAAAAIGVAAQTGAPPDQQPARPPAGAQSQAAGANRGAADKVTITGCVERAPNVAATTGTAGAAPSNAKFLLTKASPSAAGAASTGEAKAGAGMTYRLDDAAESKISPHVGHKVEITGTLSEERPAPSATGTAGGGAAGRATTASPELKVDSVKMLAASCTE